MTGTILPLFVPGGMGPPELMIILILAILLFGANKIPKLARSTGEAIGEFQKGKEKVDKELEEMRQTAELDTGAETASDETATRQPDSESQAASTLREDDDAGDTTATEPEDATDNTTDEDAESETEPETETET